ncbi:hypothetical protein TorRG33x02_275240 [Trema orientale]|uniref:Uncharacterized protein n=1 Tax=Trema orientale TaxID=63057 RepID=A0A2P5CRY6_TREOI|nr:hypothetical protein TorRG33x02_275240 [Trema orientale]
MGGSAHSESATKDGMNLDKEDIPSTQMIIFEERTDEEESLKCVQAIETFNKYDALEEMDKALIPGLAGKVALLGHSNWAQVAKYKPGHGLSHKEGQVTERVQVAEYIPGQVPSYEEGQVTEREDAFGEKGTVEKAKRCPSTYGPRPNFSYRYSNKSLGRIKPRINSYSKGDIQRWEDDEGVIRAIGKREKRSSLNYGSDETEYSVQARTLLQKSMSYFRQLYYRKRDEAHVTPRREDNQRDCDALENTWAFIEGATKVEGSDGGYNADSSNEDSECVGEDEEEEPEGDYFNVDHSDGPIQLFQDDGTDTDPKSSLAKDEKSGPNFNESSPSTHNSARGNRDNEVEVLGHGVHLMDTIAMADSDTRVVLRDRVTVVVSKLGITSGPWLYFDSSRIRLFQNLDTALAPYNFPSLYKLHMSFVGFFIL